MPRVPVVVFFVWKGQQFVGRRHFKKKQMSVFISALCIQEIIASVLNFVVISYVTLPVRQSELLGVVEQTVDTDLWF